MAHAIVYTKGFCPYCHKVLATMDQLGITYTDIDVTNDQVAHKEMVERSGGRTVPQVFLHVGGSDDFHKLLEEGALNPLIQE